METNQGEYVTVFLPRVKYSASPWDGCVTERLAPLKVFHRAKDLVEVVCEAGRDQVPDALGGTCEAELGLSFEFAGPYICRLVFRRRFDPLRGRRFAWAFDADFSAWRYAGHQATVDCGQIHERIAEHIARRCRFLFEWLNGTSQEAAAPRRVGLRRKKRRPGSTAAGDP